MMGVAIVGQGQALIGQTSEEIVLYHKGPSGLVSHRGYQAVVNDDSMLVLVAKYFTTFAFIDTFDHVCHRYSIVVHDTTWKNDYENYLATHYEDFKRKEWVTDDGMIIIESVGEMSINWMGIVYKGHVFTSTMKQ
jgi:hypothetical protein